LPEIVAKLHSQAQNQLLSVHDWPDWALLYLQTNLWPRKATLAIGIKLLLLLYLLLSQIQEYWFSKLCYM